MSVIEHLEALRRALLIAIIAWGVATIAAVFIAHYVITFLVDRAGIGHAKWLYKRRPYWFLGLGILANFLTPGVDPLTPMIVFVPLYLFFEGTALLLKLLGR